MPQPRRDRRGSGPACAGVRRAPPPSLRPRSACTCGSAGAEPSTAARQVTCARSAACGIRSARAIAGTSSSIRMVPCSADAAPLGIAAGARNLEAADLDVVGGPEARAAAEPGQARGDAFADPPRRRAEIAGERPAVEHHVPGQHAWSSCNTAPPPVTRRTMSMPSRRHQLQIDGLGRNPGCGRAARTPDSDENARYPAPRLPHAAPPAPPSWRRSSARA